MGLFASKASLPKTAPEESVDEKVNDYYLSKCILGIEQEMPPGTAWTVVVRKTDSIEAERYFNTLRTSSVHIRKSFEFGPVIYYIVNADNVLLKHLAEKDYVRKIYLARD